MGPTKSFIIGLKPKSIFPFHAVSRQMDRMVGVSTSRSAFEAGQLGDQGVFERVDFPDKAEKATSDPRADGTSPTPFLKNVGADLIIVKLRYDFLQVEVQFSSSSGARTFGSIKILLLSSPPLPPTPPQPHQGYPSEGCVPSRTASFSSCAGVACVWGKRIV